MTRRTLGALIPIAAGAALVLSGCLGGAGPVTPGAAPSAPGPADGDVIGTGTVLDDGSGPQLCLGPVAESYPPQCSGPAIVGWDWSNVEGWEQASGVTWGAYAVQGEWDGERFTLAQPPIMLALYDPMAEAPDPRFDPANAGDTAESRLLEIQSEVHNLDVGEIFASIPMNGRILLEVFYDDGSLQRYLDERYGEDVLVVHSALRTIEG